ncbi:MAG: hypothetical protein ACFFD2_17140 [Promethearchaeota archaeon]
MTVADTSQNILAYSPDIYKGSYKDIFTHVNFNFSVFSNVDSENGVGRPKKPSHTLFGAAVLKNLALNSGFRTIEAILKQDQ